MFVHCSFNCVSKFEIKTFFVNVNDSLAVRQFFSVSPKFFCFAQILFRPNIFVSPFRNYFSDSRELFKNLAPSRKKFLLKIDNILMILLTPVDWIMTTATFLVVSNLFLSSASVSKKKRRIASILGPILSCYVHILCILFLFFERVSRGLIRYSECMIDDLCCQM